MKLYKIAICLMVLVVVGFIAMDSVVAKGSSGSGRSGGFSGGKSFGGSFKSSGSSYKASSSSPTVYKSGYTRSIKSGTTKSYQGKTVIYKNNGWYDSFTGAFIGASLADMMFDDSDYEDIPQETPGFEGFGALIAMGMLFVVLRR